MCFSLCAASASAVTDSGSAVARRMFLRLSYGHAVPALFWKGPGVWSRRWRAVTRRAAGRAAECGRQHGLHPGPAGAHAFCCCLWPRTPCRTPGETLIISTFTSVVWDDWMLSTDFLPNSHQPTILDKLRLCVSNRDHDSELNKIMCDKIL